MEFKIPDRNLTYIEQQINTQPCINIIDKETFDKRVADVFNILWLHLAKSFGPGGAGTFISIYPNYYNTKDGFTIMKNIAFDKKLDQVISDMVMTICNRLNFTVGDGTTTATIATKSTYDNYQKYRDFFETKNILPRDILSKFENFKNILIKKLNKAAIPIRSDDPDELAENIRKVVSISSNENKEVTDMITSLYKELLYPAISSTLSKDGITKYSIVEGYKLDISLTDKIYINNDNNTLLLDGSDVIIFDHKVMKETYEKILKPLSMVSATHGRHLVCIAPFYDETALSGVIRLDLNAEYRKTQNINLVLTACTKATGYSRVLLDDLAMLLNTMVITPSMENEYIAKLSRQSFISKVFDVNNRGINGINVSVESPEGGSYKIIPYNDDIPDSKLYGHEWKEETFRIGYCDKLNLGLKESTFSGFYYDKNTYDTYVSTAKAELDEIQKKCQTIGTFSLELTQKQQRVYALGLKTGLIEVGSTSELSQGYLKDVVDDAVKAAASAYNNGVVLGCNVTLIKLIDELLSESTDDVDKMLLTILRDGYIDVYKTVLGNVFENRNVNIRQYYEGLSEENDRIDNTVYNIDMIKQTMCEISPYDKFSIDKDSFMNAFKGSEPIPNNIYDIIVRFSMESNSVFNLSNGCFDNDVINSAETDKEILKATIDLLALLITGNQLVLC